MSDLRQEILKLKQDIREEQKLFKSQKENPDELFGRTRAKMEKSIYRENLLEFTTKKKEIMMLQYSLHIKQAEIERMEKTLKEEEEFLIQEEKRLDEEGNKFDNYLKENDKSCMEALKKAEAETKNRLEKTQELKRLTHQTVSFKNELTKNEDQITDLSKYRDFLFTAFSRTNEGELKGDVKEMEGLPFTQAVQIMEILSALEESNLSLIQACQETEESIEELKKRSNCVISEGEAKLKNLSSKNEITKESISLEDKRINELQERIKRFSSFGNDENSIKLLHELNLTVRDAYEQCIGKADDSLKTIFMLTAIENKLEKVFDVIESLPQEKVEQAEKQREKERRQRVRGEKLEAQKKMQEERARKALERALAATSIIKKPIDRKEFYKPRLIKKVSGNGKQEGSQAVANNEDDLWFYLQ